MKYTDHVRNILEFAKMLFVFLTEKLERKIGMGTFHQTSI